MRNRNFLLAVVTAEIAPVKVHPNKFKVVPRWCSRKELQVVAKPCFEPLLGLVLSGNYFSCLTYAFILFVFPGFWQAGCLVGVEVRGLGGEMTMARVA